MVRAAFLHFAALATAFDGRGLPGADDPATVKRDMACLQQVVALLLGHRNQMLKRRRKAVAHELITLVTPIYRAHILNKKETRAELLTHIRQVVVARGTAVPEWWIDRLAPERSAFRLTTRHKHGAVATARYIVCEVLLKISASSLSTAKRSPSLDRQQLRSMFGVVPSAAMVRAHARQALDWAPPTDHVEHQVAVADAHQDKVMRAALESLPAIMKAAADDMTGRTPSLEDIPFLRGFAATHPAVRETITKHFTDSVAGKGHDAETLATAAADERMAELVAALLRMFDGEEVPPLPDTAIRAATEAPATEGVAR
jgi:hypothetical protein